MKRGVLTSFLLLRYDMDCYSVTKYTYSTIG